MTDSIFTKIIKGEIPAPKIYEDELTYAFLDHNPVTPGHTLVIPKHQVEYVWDLSEEEYKAVMDTARKVANNLKGVLRPKWVGMQVEGVAIPHAHVHIFGFNSVEEFRKVPDISMAPSSEELQEMAKKLRFQ